MTTDVPLSEQGKQRAMALKDLLLTQKIKHIFSTDYKRTMATAQPLAAASGIPILPYQATDTLFVGRLKRITAGNVLVVGHSNTVDDLVNGLTGKSDLQDLQDSQYGDLFIIKKRLNKYRFSRSRFGL
jgi:broad specificity phosphatase PhoE